MVAVYEPWLWFDDKSSKVDGFQQTNGSSLSNWDWIPFLGLSFWLLVFVFQKSLWTFTLNGLEKTKKERDNRGMEVTLKRFSICFGHSKRMTTFQIPLSLYSFYSKSVVLDATKEEWRVKWWEMTIWRMCVQSFFWLQRQQFSCGWRFGSVSWFEYKMQFSFLSQVIFFCWADWKPLFSPHLFGLEVVDDGKKTDI